MVEGALRSDGRTESGMSVTTRAGVVEAIQTVIEKELAKHALKPSCSTGDREWAELELESAYTTLDEALKDFEKDIKEQL